LQQNILFFWFKIGKINKILNFENQKMSDSPVQDLVDALSTLGLHTLPVVINATTILFIFPFLS
jgi:hypothetical protein